MCLILTRLSIVQCNRNMMH